jgi:PleD family two-component response regulator
MTMGSSGKILVVDDDEDSRTLLAHLLKREGYEVATAVDGQDAVEKLPDDSIDVLLLDVMMPRMDGFAVCKALKKDPKTASLPVILLTARDDMETRANGMKLGVSDFLAKPVNKQELFQRVRTQIEAIDRARHLAETEQRIDSID